MGPNESKLVQIGPNCSIFIFFLPKNPHFAAAAPVMTAAVGEGGGECCQPLCRRQRKKTLGATICIGREIRCLRYAGFFADAFSCNPLTLYQRKMYKFIIPRKNWHWVYFDHSNLTVVPFGPPLVALGLTQNTTCSEQNLRQS